MIPNKFTIYTTRNCHKCHIAKIWLNKLEVNCYTEILILSMDEFDSLKKEFPLAKEFPIIVSPEGNVFYNIEQFKEKYFNDKAN